jgi:hypothetical protein
VFTFAYTALTFPRDSFLDIYTIFLGVYWCASAYGYLVAVLCPPSLAQLLGVTAIFANSMFAGGLSAAKVVNQELLEWCMIASMDLARLVILQAVSLHLRACRRNSLRFVTFLLFRSCGGRSRLSM